MIPNVNAEYTFNETTYVFNATELQQLYDDFNERSRYFAGEISQIRMGYIAVADAIELIEAELVVKSDDTKFNTINENLNTITILSACATIISICSLGAVFFHKHSRERKKKE
jgi:hypothetical protein